MQIPLMDAPAIAFGYGRAALWRRMLRDTTFIGLTGSDGKTTAKECLANILTLHGPTVASLRNLNSVRGVPQTLLRCKPDTSYAVVEVGVARPGLMTGLAGALAPHVAVITRISQEHRRAFRNVEATAAEKARLVAALQPGGVAVLNADDPLLRDLEPPPGCSTVRFGTESDADVRLIDARSDWPDRLRMTAVARGRTLDLRTRLLGVHNAPIALSAVAAAVALDVPDEAIVEGLRRASPPPGRMSPVLLDNGATIVRDEMFGSLHTLWPGLDFLANARAARRMLVISDVMNTSASPRRRMRQIVHRFAPVVDHFVFLGDSRFHGQEAALRAGKRADQVDVFDHQFEAAPALRELLGPGDLVLLKGWTEHHLARLVFLQQGEIACRRLSCMRYSLCDECEQLGPDVHARRLLRDYDSAVLADDAEPLP